MQETILLHLALSDPRLQQAVDRLRREFAGSRYAGRSCRLRSVVIEENGQSRHAVDSEAAAEATWRTVNQVIARIKERGQRIHLCVTGGPRMIGLLAMSVAVLHFDHQDSLWHLYTPRDLRQRADEGAILHVEPDEGVRLIRVPMAPWGAYFPALRMLTSGTPDQVIGAQNRWMSGVDHACCRAVVEKLSPRQLEVLQAFAAGHSPQDVAEQLVISLKTVDSHKSVILAECRNAWGLEEDERLTYHFLRDKFGPFWRA